MPKAYNLATTELINKLVEVGAKTDDVCNRNHGGLMYRVRVRTKFIDDINPLLTGSKMSLLTHKGWHALYSKDVWHALRNSDVRRTSYGHVKKHCGYPVREFTFSDKSTITLCLNPFCTVFDGHRQRVLASPMMGVR